mgnify:CR=1 FL=1
MSRFKPMRDDEVEVDWKRLREPPFVCCDLCHTLMICPDKSSMPDGWTKDIARPRRDYCPACTEKRKEAASSAASSPTVV